MINKTLLLGAFLLMSALSIAQDRASIDSRIAEKEFGLKVNQKVFFFKIDIKMGYPMTAV